MAWCHQATSHYLSQCWPRSMSPYGITRPQWVKILRPIQYSQHLLDGILKLVFLKKINGIKILIDIPWSLLLRVQWALNQNCFRKWLDFKQMPGCYLNQQGPILPTFLWVNLAKELSCISNISVYLTSMILLQYSFLTHCSIMTVWCCGPWWTLIHMIICCMMALSHYLNQCWLIISRVLHHSHKTIALEMPMKVIT